MLMELVPTTFRLVLGVREWSGKAKQVELPVPQPPAVAFTAFTDERPSAT